MVITSFYFLIFTGLSLGIYYLLPRKLQNLWLLLISYVFIISWDWTFAALLGLVSVFHYGLALVLERDGIRKPTWLWVGIGLNVFLLIFFRTANFFLPELSALMGRLGIHTKPDALQILAPLGLSFYVLGNISYLVDVHRGQMRAATNFLDLALYLAYFPKLIAGPIERAQSFLPKLAQPRVVDNGTFARSIMLIFVGVARKVFIADILMGSILWDAYQNPAKYTPVELSIWLVVYAFGLYNDFAGYSNIVRGISGLFGIELNINFLTPYFSRSFTEFWTRWHISLSEWLRDYIYFPISRALLRRDPRRESAVNLILPPMTTMLVSGLWHGFSLNMLLWGGMHGIYLVAERVRNLRHPTRPQDQPLYRQILSMLVVFAFVCLAWIPFSWGLHQAFEFWAALFNWGSFDVRYRRMYFLVPVLFLSLIIDFLQYYKKDEFIFLKWPRPLQAACMALVVVLVFILTSGDFKQPFVYQAF